MKVVILGAESMLGYALRQVFNFDKVLAYSHNTFDITNVKHVTNHFRALKPDMVINCAAVTDVDKAEKVPYVAELVNSLAAKALTQMCKQVNARFVQFSTEMVFKDEIGKVGYVESDIPICGANVYGETKRNAEQFIRAELEQHYIIRTSWLFGPGGKKSNFVTKILDRAKEQSEIDVVCDQFGCPTYTFDLARAVRELVLVDAAPYGTYHLTNSVVTSRDAWAYDIIDYASLNCNVNPVLSESVKSGAPRPKNGVLKNTLRPQLRPWDQALVEYLMGCGEMFKH